MPEEQGNTPTPQPQTPATPAQGQATTGQQNVTPTLNQEALGKLQEKANLKYGGDLNKAIEGLSNAESKMHEATTERKQFEAKVQELQQELEIARQQQSMGGFSQGHSVSQPNDIERQRIEAEYGKPYEEVMASFKIAQIANLPILEMVSEQKIEGIKQNLKQTDPMFTDVVASKFDSLIRQRDPRDRMNPIIVKDCLERAKGQVFNAQSFNDIVEAKVQERLKAFTGGNPVNPPSSNPPTGATTTTAKKLTIDEAHAARIAQASGMSLDQVKEMYSE